MAAMQAHWDIFCRVIDNFGDIGVCWRLARQLAAEHGKRVRLWVDHRRASHPAARQGRCGAAVAVRRRRRNPPLARQFPDRSDAAEGRRCGDRSLRLRTAPRHLAAMARVGRPRWINLGTFPPNPGSESCHGVHRPTPPCPGQHFFLSRVPRAGPAACCGNPASSPGGTAFSPACPVPRPLEIFLFCYDTAPVGELIETWSAADYPIRCHVPPGKPPGRRGGHRGRPRPLAAGGALSALPFLPWTEYDQLLWRCDVNFVRGEGLLRACPMGRQALRLAASTPRRDAAHEAKLEAFLWTAYGDGRICVWRESRAAELFSWNRGSGVGRRWLNSPNPAAGAGGPRPTWVGSLASGPDLASSLVVLYCRVII